MHGLQLLHQNAQSYIKGLDTFKVQTTEGDKSIHGQSQSHAEQRAKSMGYKLKCKNCTVVNHGQIVWLIPAVKGYKCPVCGRMVDELYWELVPWYQKLKRWFLYRNN